MNSHDKLRGNGGTSLNAEPTKCLLVFHLSGTPCLSEGHFSSSLQVQYIVFTDVTTGACGIGGRHDGELLARCYRWVRVQVRYFRVVRVQ